MMQRDALLPEIWHRREPVYALCVLDCGRFLRGGVLPLGEGDF